MSERSPERPNSRFVGSLAPLPEPRRIVSFGTFEVDLASGELRRNGLKVKLQDQPLQVLTILLERAGDVVTRDELHAQLWPADTFVDFDHGLNAAIKRLRDALGDSADSPRYVETLARRGYRFVAPVHGFRPAPAPAATVVVAQPSPSRRWLVVAGGVALLLLGVSLGLFLGRSSQSTASVRSARLTANPTDVPVSSALISPDGRYLAFADETGFYLRQIDTDETHPLALPPGFMARPGNWFPDGTHMVAVVANKPSDRPGLWEISSIGGTPRQLAEEGWSPAVSPDGSRIAFVRGSQMNQQIWLMRSDGAQPQKLTGEEGDYFNSLVWSPDGNHLAYAKGRFFVGTGIKASIEVFDLMTHRAEAILAPLELGPSVAWTADHRLLYTLREPVPNRSDSNLWSVDISNTGQLSGTPVRVSNGPGAIAQVSLSADGKRLAFIKQTWQPDVYIAELKADRKGIDEPKRLTLDERDDLPYDWTSDGKQVLFISDRSGSYSIYKQAIDRTTPDLLVRGQDAMSIARLSPDGTQMLYLVYPKGGQLHPVISLMRVPLAGGAPQLVVEGPDILNHQCARLPATLCVYSQVRDGGVTFFTFDPFRGKGRQVLQIKDDLPFAYHWTLSPDGAMFAIVKKLDLPNQPYIRLVPVAGGRERTIRVTGWSGFAGIDWAADSKSLWLSAFMNDDKTTLLNIDREGRTVPVWKPKNMSVGWAIPSRDGKKLALWQASGGSNVWMLENF